MKTRRQILDERATPPRENRILNANVVQADKAGHAQQIPGVRCRQFRVPRLDPQPQLAA